MGVQERRDGAITVITIDRPEAHNAVDHATAVDLADAIRRFGVDDDAAVLVLTGAGPTSFCAGADLKGIPELLGDDEFCTTVGPMGFAKLDPAKPTIAAINGYCFAGGLELAAWCDFRIAEQHAEFGALNRRWGVPFFDGGTQRLPRILGLSNALWLMQTGVRIDVQRARELGFVQEVVPTGQAVERAVELARYMAGYPQASIRSDREAILDSNGRRATRDWRSKTKRAAGRCLTASCSNGCRRSHAATGRPHPAQDDRRTQPLRRHGIRVEGHRRPRCRRSHGSSSGSRSISSRPATGLCHAHALRNRHDRRRPPARARAGRLRHQRPLPTDRGRNSKRTRPGDSYIIPANVEHSLRVLEGGFVVDASRRPETTTAEAPTPTTTRRAGPV